jgi:hypothetical protein
MHQTELSDKSMSVRNELLAMPEFNVGLPFQYLQSVQFPCSEYVNATNQFTNPYLDKQQNLNISSIINSDLTTFLFHVEDTYYSARSGGTHFQPQWGAELYNLELKLNGQRFFNFDHDSYNYLHLTKHIDMLGYRVIFNTEAATAALKASVKEYAGHLYEFNNSRIRSLECENDLQNTARFTNQTFQLSFYINRGSGQYATFTDGAAKSYMLYLTYCYNAVFLIGGDGGTTKLITN